MLHFGNSGQFLAHTGGGRFVPRALDKPGALAFGPNGNLYVADTGADKIFEFDTSSSTQQYVQEIPLTFRLDGIAFTFKPGGIAFANDSTQDLIVGDLTDQSVQSYDGSSWTTLDLGGGVNAVALATEANGSLLIADAGGTSGNDQILQYTLDASTPATTQLIGPAVLGAAQPASLLLDTDGNLLVGLSSGDGSGTVEKFDPTGTLIGTIATGISAPSGLALVQSQVSDLLAGDYNNGGALRFSAAGQPLATGGAPGRWLFPDHGGGRRAGWLVLRQQQGQRPWRVRSDPALQRCRRPPECD